MTRLPDTAPSCMACDLISGAEPPPGGTIHRSAHWVVEHCLGPLGVGTLIVKPIRHVVHLADLEAAEAAELGALLRQAAAAVTELANPEQVYTCLWSHTNRQPVHIHYVVQPVSTELMQQYDAYGPLLQVAMFQSNEMPPLPEVEDFAARAASWFAANVPMQ
jgi:diadenosine tetraphosphate (Ap4A) HIT family hydrolase